MEVEIWLIAKDDQRYAETSFFGRIYRKTDRKKIIQRKPARIRGFGNHHQPTHTQFWPPQSHCKQIQGTKVKGSAVTTEQYISCHRWFFISVGFLYQSAEQNVFLRSELSPVKLIFLQDGAFSFRCNCWKSNFFGSEKASMCPICMFDAKKVYPNIRYIAERTG